MPATHHHGIKTNEITTGTRPSATASTAVIGMVATAPDANEAAFPFDAPVRFNDIYAAIAKAGSGGTLSKSLKAIADQCNPTVVVVRVAEGAASEGVTAEEATTENVIGGVTEQGQKTGLQALLASKSLLGVTPKIIGVPGLDVESVTAGLVSIAAKLDGFAYAGCSGDNITAAKAYRTKFSSRELMLLWHEFSDFEGSAVARAMGLRARIDQEVGWHRSLSNTPVRGVTGLSKPVFFDISGENTDAQELNDAEITALINDDGFRFWGNRTTSDDPLFAFEVATRSGAAVRETIRDTLRWAIDKPIVASLLKDITETGNAGLSKLVNQGRLIGASLWIDPSKNPPSELAAGQIVIDYDYTPCAPAESITLNQRITDTYYHNVFA